MDAEAADQRAFAAHLRGPGAAPRGVTNGRGAPAADRLRVYRNNVIVSLADALAASFPATVRLLGEDFFKNAAVAYAEAHKPRSPILARYGEGFPDFLAALPGVARYPFVPEAARIEFARIEATHAADAPPLAGDALAALPPERLGPLTLTPHPAARIVATQSGGLSAWRTNQTPPLPAVEAAAALVTRPQFSVIVTPLDATAAAFAEALWSGAPLGEAAAAPGLDVSAALALLVSAGAFGGFVPNG